MVPVAKIIIIVLNWNQKELTLACLASLQKLDDPHFAVIVADNGSTDGSIEAIQDRFPSYPILENRTNLGYAEGNNRALSLALLEGAPFILLLNNDTIVDPGLLRAFRKEAAAHPGVGIFGAKIVRFDDPSRLDHFGGVWNPKTATFTLIGLGEKENSYTSSPCLDYLCGCALFIRREVFSIIGLFDSSFFLFWEEADFCYRARAAGYRLRVCLDALVLHHGSASFTGGKPHTSYYWWRSRCRFLQKHGKQSYRLLLTKEVGRLAKIDLLLSLQRLFSPRCPQKKQKQLQKRAALLGVLDHFRKRYGEKTGLCETATEPERLGRTALN